MAGRGRKSGFSLLELMISLAVLSMVTVALVSTIGVGQRVWEKSETRGEETADALLRVRLRDLLERMPLPPGPNTAAAVFRGTDEGFDFLSEPAEGADFWPGEMVQVSLTVIPDGSAFRVIVIKKGLAQETRSELRRRFEFPQNFGRVAVNYYGRQDIDDTPAWHDHWRSATLLPDLVKVEMIDIGGFVYPPLTVRPARFARQRFMSLSSFEPPG